MKKTPGSSAYLIIDFLFLPQSLINTTAKRMTNATAIIKTRIERNLLSLPVKKSFNNSVCNKVKQSVKLRAIRGKKKILSN